MIRVVTGHICAGKTWLVRERSNADDVIVDFDSIALALSHHSTRQGDYADQVLQVARLVRWLAIDEAVRLHKRGSFDLWIIHAYPTDDELARYRRLGATLVELEVDAATLRRRAAAQRTSSAQAELERRLKNLDISGQNTTNQQTPLASAEAKTAKTPVFRGKTGFFHRGGVGVGDKTAPLR